ncbi:MAG: HD domain-containing phosphohydrolase [Pseudomonadota bacterium]
MALPNDPLLLAVEDDPGSMELLVAYPASGGYGSVLRAENTREARALFSRHSVDLVYLDVMLPDGDGFSLTRQLKESASEFVPIILVTALNSTSDKVQGLNAGADDFITKPLIREELIARTASHLRTKRMMDQVAQYQTELAGFNKRLRKLVRDRTQQLKAALTDLQLVKDDVEETRRELIERLGIAAEYRDEATGFHIQRMAHYVHQIALSMGLSEREAELMRIAAPMHDLGKLGIRDRILHKPTELEEDEYNVMKRHPLIGAQILANPRTDLLKVAYDMARNHHECWDGTGYPDGLAGEGIPLSARICAVADVFDALTSGRIYRPEAYPIEKAVEEISHGAGTRFDPLVVAAFEDTLPGILADREHIGTE